MTVSGRKRDREKDGLYRHRGREREKYRVEV